MSNQNFDPGVDDRGVVATLIDGRWVHGKEIPWRAKKGVEYWVVVGGSAVKTYEHFTGVDDSRYDEGNYFETQGIALASIGQYTTELSAGEALTALADKEEIASDGITDDTKAIQAEIGASAVETSLGHYELDWISISKGVTRSATKADIAMRDRDDIANGNEYRPATEFKNYKAPKPAPKPAPEQYAPSLFERYP